MAYTTIDDPTLYFSTTIYTGDGQQNRAVTIDGTGMQPDWLWVKGRSEAEGHVVGDSIRGATLRLIPNANDAEATRATNIASFTSDGFTVANGGVDNAVNKNSQTFVSWAWKESATAGFDIVTYSGSAASSKTISHSLSAVPKMIIVKCRNAAENWAVYHHALGNTHALFLNTTGASSDTPVFADTTPTSSVFSVSADDRTGADGKTYVAYCFADVKGYSKFGSYTGNGNANGTFIYTGFKPAFVIIKATSGTENWRMYDNKRNGFNVDNEQLFPNLSNAEASDADLDILSNGFKCQRNSGGFNGSGTTYIYMAFAENPFVTSTGVPATAR